MKNFKKLFTIFSTVILSTVVIALAVRASTITTINGSDTISSSRAVINTNFSNLNNDKAELSGGTFTGHVVFSAGASSSAGFEATKLGLNAGTKTDTILEVGGTASISGAFTTYGTFTLGDSGDTGSIDTSDWDVSTGGAFTGVSGINNDGAYTQSGTSANTLTGNLIGTGASFSLGEFTSYASASAYKGSAFPSSNCTSSGNVIRWATTGLFTCGTLADADIPDTITASNYQPVDTTLTAFAAYNTNGILTQTAADTFTGRTLTGTSQQITITNGDGVSGNPTWSLPSLLVFPGAASTSSNIEIGGYASASKYFGVALSNLGGTTGCAGATDTLNYNSSTGVFSCGSDATGSFDGTVIDAVTWSNGAQASNLWTFNLSGTDPTLLFRSGGFTFTGNASVSSNFEAVGYASASQFFGAFASHSFLGSITGNADNTLTLGSVARSLKEVWSKIVRVATNLFIPNGMGGATANATSAGSIAVDTSSRSFNFGDGTNENVLRSKSCFTYAFEAPTTTENWGSKKFTDPFTISDISLLASGSNAVGWTFLHGVSGSITTNTFAANKSASSSTSPTYTTFADATLADGEFLQLRIASPSATIENLDLTVCGRYDP